MSDEKDYPKAPVEETPVTPTSLTGTEFSPSQGFVNSVVRDDKDPGKKGVAAYFGKAGDWSCGTGTSGGMGGMGGSFSSLKYHAIRPDLVNNSLAAEVLLPKDLRSQHKLFRQIYLFDFVAGPATELWSSIPWSTFDLVGISDEGKMQIYKDAVEKLDLPSHLPWLTLEFLILGKLCVHLIFDAAKGIWTDMIVHNPDYIKVTPVPLVGQDPIVDLLPDPTLIQFANSPDRRLRAIASKLQPKVRVNLAAGKAIALDSLNTMYLPRRCSPYDYIGTSMYMRLLDLVAFERAILTATITVAHRRSGPLRVVTMGNDQWEPTEPEMTNLARMLLAAEEDPAGSIVVVKRDVEFADQPNLGSETWKISDEWAFLQEAKLKALGLSDSFISGEATYSTADMVLSVFLERIRTLRELITNKLIYNKILEPIARVHNIYKTTTASLSHRIRIGAPDQRQVDMPSVVWKKQLTPQGDQNYLTILDTIASKGVPITLKTWATAGALDLEAELDQLEQDTEIRKKIKQWQKETGQLDDQMGGGGGGGMFANLKDSPVKFVASTWTAPTLTEHPFYNKNTKKFLSIHTGFITDKVVPLLKDFDRKTAGDKKQTLQHVKHILGRLTPLDRDTVYYMLRLSGLPCSKISDASAYHFIEQLQNREKPQHAIYWQSLYSILQAKESVNGAKGSTKPKFTGGLPIQLQKLKTAEDKLSTAQLLTGLIKSEES